MLPNLRARDACLREATARALTALWTEERGAMGAVAAGEGGAARAETAAEGVVKADVKAEAKTEVKADVEADVKTDVEADVKAAEAKTEASEGLPQPALKTKTPGETARVKLMATTAANVAPLLDDADGGVREAAAECMGHLKESATSHLDALRALMKNDREEAVRDGGRRDDATRVL